MTDDEQRALAAIAGATEYYAGLDDMERRFDGLNHWRSQTSAAFEVLHVSDFASGPDLEIGDSNVRPGRVSIQAVAAADNQAETPRLENAGPAEQPKETGDRLIRRAALLRRIICESAATERRMRDAIMSDSDAIDFGPDPTARQERHFAALEREVGEFLHACETSGIKPDTSAVPPANAGSEAKKSPESPAPNPNAPAASEQKTTLAAEVKHTEKPENAEDSGTPTDGRQHGRQLNASPEQPHHVSADASAFNDHVFPRHASDTQHTEAQNASRQDDTEITYDQYAPLGTSFDALASQLGQIASPNDGNVFAHEYRDVIDHDVTTPPAPQDEGDDVFAHLAEAYHFPEVTEDKDVRVASSPSGDSITHQREFGADASLLGGVDDGRGASEVPKTDP